MMGKLYKLLAGVLISLLCVGMSFGDTTMTFLPESSHYDGRSYFQNEFVGEGYVNGFIDFAVYDTEDGEEFEGDGDGDEFGAAGFTAPGEGRFIYAYQVFLSGSGSDNVDFFKILGIGEGAIDSDSNMGTEDDGMSGTDASEYSLSPTKSSAAWGFEDGALIPGDHTFFLLMRSDHDYTSGSYAFEPIENETVVPNPEPTSIALLALGGAILRKRRK
jgi:hypothetical protein